MQSVFTHLFHQSGAAAGQVFRGASHHSSRVRQSLLDEDDTWGAFADANEAVRVQDCHALHQVSQFSHIADPAVLATIRRTSASSENKGNKNDFTYSESGL